MEQIRQVEKALIEAVKKVKEDKRRKEEMESKWEWEKREKEEENQRLLIQQQNAPIVVRTSSLPIVAAEPLYAASDCIATSLPSGAAPSRSVMSSPSSTTSADPALPNRFSSSSSVPVTNQLNLTSSNPISPSPGVNIAISSPLVSPAIVASTPPIQAPSLLAAVSSSPQPIICVGSPSAPLPSVSHLHFGFISSIIIPFSYSFVSI